MTVANYPMIAADVEYLRKVAIFGTAAEKIVHVIADVATAEQFVDIDDDPIAGHQTAPSDSSPAYVLSKSLSPKP